MTMAPTETTIESLLDRNNQLEAQIESLNENLRSLNETFQTKIRLMQRQIEDLLKRLYGRSRERIGNSWKSY